MSLINQMLRDLEARQHGQPGSHPAAAVYHDLAAVPRPDAPQSHRTIVLALLAVAALLAAFVGWRYGMRPAPAPVPSAVVVPGPSANRPADSAAIEPAQPLLPPASARAMPLEAQKTASTSPRTADAPLAAARRPPAVPEPEARGDAQGRASPQPGHPWPAALASVPSASPAPRGSAIGARGDITKVAQPPSPQELAASAYQQAVAAIRTGRSAEADELLRRALHLDPRHTAAREALVGLLLQQGHAAEAQALLEEGIGVTPHYYRFAQLAARLAVEQGAETRALVLLERGAPHARQDPEYQAFYAALLQRAGRHDEAARNYGQALDQRPLEVRWWLGLAISLESQQRWSAAANAYKRSLQGASLDAGLRKFAEQRLAGVKARQD